MVVVSAEQVAGAAVLAGLGVGVLVVGVLGMRGSLQYALGHWTPETATVAGWSRAHRTIGGWFGAGGLVAFAGAAAVLAGSDRSAGPIVVIGSIAMLVPVVVGVSSGLRRLERRT